MSSRRLISLFRKTEALALPKLSLAKTTYEKWPILTKVESWIEKYEDFIGIKQVKEAHGRVLQAETEFVIAQEQRRQAQIHLNEMQVRLREVRTDLDRTPRGDDNYLELVKREIELIREERVLRDKFEGEEKRERELFNNLSSALRFSHEKERAQNEKTKYWSVMASVFGALLGIFGTTINSHIKQKQMRQLLVENTQASTLPIIQKLDNMTQNHPNTPTPQDPQSQLILVEIQNLSELVSSRLMPITSNSSTDSHVIAPLLELNEQKRRQELLVAMASLIVIIPIILKFISS